MPIAETVRFASLKAQVLAESYHSPEGENTVLISSRARVREVSAGAVSIRLLDAASNNVLDEAPLGPDGGGALHLGLHAFQPPTDRDFKVQLVSSGGSVTGYLTIVHPVTTATLAAIRSSREAPLTVPAQLSRPDPPVSATFNRPRELIPLVVEGEDVCEVHPSNKDIEPIFYRKVCTTNFMTSVVPARNSDMQAIPF